MVGPFVIAELIAFLQVLCAYALVDMLTGVYHWATDNGWNIPSQVAIFRVHHDTGEMDHGFDWWPMLVGLPSMVIGLAYGSTFWAAAGGFGCLAQIPHYYAHYPEAGGWLVRLLQRTGIIITTEAHNRHHSGKFDRDFCILSGWNNWWMNRLLRRA